LVLGFATALIFKFREIIKSRTQRGAAATELQTRSEFTQVYEAAKRRVAQGHCQKKFPRVERTTSHKEKTICAEISPNARRCQRVFYPPIRIAYVKRYLLPFRGGPHCTSATDRPIALWKLEQIQPGQMPAAFLAATSKPNFLSCVLMFFATRILKGDI
jgi:hypothetical protein